MNKNPCRMRFPTLVGCVLTTLVGCNWALADQTTCLASTIYHEARSQPALVKTDIVIAVTLNRAADERLGGKFGYAPVGTRIESHLLDVCKVIHAKGQYQWVRRMQLIPAKDSQAWQDALSLAKSTLSNPYYTVTSRRFFNIKRLGRLHKTDAKQLTIAGMTAY